MLLVGDIGGTKTDLALFASLSESRIPVARRRFVSAAYTGLEGMVQAFLSALGVQVRAACFDVAGPVVAGHARLTNLPWKVDAGCLRRDLNLEAVWVINDVAAMAHAVPRLLPEDLCVLNPGIAAPGGTLAVLAPGTGLGEAFVVWDGQQYREYPSEGGHADFAPQTASHMALLRYLQERLGHVSYEMVCSGMGIPHLYEFFRDSGLAPEQTALAAVLASSADRTPLIVESGLSRDDPCPLCVAALDAFVTILGAESGNLALKVLATGGVYLGGGMPLRLQPCLTDGRFMQAFCDKGRFRELLAAVPVHMITNPDVALLGAAHYGWTQLAASAAGMSEANPLHAPGPVAP